MSFQIFGQTEELSGHNYMAVNENGSINTNMLTSDSVVTSANPFPVREFSTVDSNNSISKTLSANEVWTGEATDTKQYGVIAVAVYSDKESATDGLSMQQSIDGTDWHWVDNYTIPANAGKTYQVQPAVDYFRVVYTNGSEATSGNVHIRTILHPDYIKPSSHRIGEGITDEDDAELVMNVNKAKDPDGNYVNIQATASENLRVTDAESGLAIAKGDVVNTTFIHKFGNAPDFDQSDGIVTIWDGADDADINQMTYVYSTSAIIDTISSSDNSDVITVEIQGLSGDYQPATQQVKLSGQTPVTLDTPLIRVFRMQNENSVDNVGRIYCYENVATTDGVPNDSTKVRAIIQPTNNQTLMAVYTVPAGKTAYLRSFYASIAGANKSSNYILDVRARRQGKVFQLKHRTSISDTGTSYAQHEYIEPEVFTEKTDLELRVQMTESGATGGSFSGGFDIVIIDN